MALDQSALLEVLEALKSADVGDRVRTPAETVYQALIEAELTDTIGDLVKALGADSGISRSEVSRICAELDTEVGAFHDRSLADQRFPYVFLDATYCKARVNHRVVSQAVVIATGSARTAGARSSGSPSVTARTARSGPRSSDP